MKRRPNVEDIVATAAREVATGAGRTPLASRPPAPRPAPRVSGPEIIGFDTNGAMTGGMETNPQSVIRGGPSMLITIVTEDVASADSTFQIRLNGVLSGDVITLLSGAAEVYHIQSLATVPQDKVRLACLTAGAGLGDPGGMGGHIQING